MKFSESGLSYSGVGVIMAEVIDRRKHYTVSITTCWHDDGFHCGAEEENDKDGLSHTDKSLIIKYCAKRHYRKNTWTLLNLKYLKHAGLLLNKKTNRLLQDNHHPSTVNPVGQWIISTAVPILFNKIIFLEQISCSDISPRKCTQLVNSLWAY